MDKIIVIGGSGFLGSHTADELSNRGYNVTLFDRVESPWLRSDQSMVVSDILDKDALEDTLLGANAVYHFAGIADIGDSKTRPFDTIERNVLGTTTVLETVRKLTLERLVFASTMYVYSPHGSFYRASKQAAETIIEAYHEEYKIPYTILRYGSLYGPRAQGWNGLRNYVEQVVSNHSLNYDGTGRERREYIHIRDAARLSVDILDKAYENRAITVTGSQVISSSDLIEMIFEIAGIEQSVTYTEGNWHDYHYSMTPYRYTPKHATKIVPAEFTDLGQGILEVVEEINRDLGDT